MAVKNSSKHTPKAIIKAIEGSGGIKSTIVKILNCSRPAFDSYLARFPSVKEAYDAECERVGDVAEKLLLNVIARQIEGANVNHAIQVAMWYLAKKHKARGYGDTEKKETEKLPDIIINVNDAK